MIPLENIRITHPGFKANPFPTYARLRAEAPVCRIVLPGRQEAYLVTRYDDVLALLKDDRFVKDRSGATTGERQRRQPWIPPVFAPLMRGMLDRDDPDHARLRGFVQKAFTPRRIEALASRIEALSEALLDRVAARGTFDLIADFALPLPVTVIADLLGVPQSDRPKFTTWSKTMIRGAASPGDMALFLPDMLAFVGYVRRLVRRRRAEPTDDLLGALVVAEEAGERLTDDELLAMVVLLLTAGHETTVNLIGNGMLALIQSPEQLERVRSDPSRLKTGIEELLRFGDPVDMATHRYASEEIEIAGVAIPRGSLTLGVLGSANRDESRFPDAEALDVARDPNRHLAFGQGTHYCLGSSLARMEGRIAVGALLRRFPSLKLGTPAEQLRWRRGLILRGLESLPLLAKSKTG